MKNQKMYESGDRMISLIRDNYDLLQVLGRFGINLGFGDKTVGEVCEGQGVALRECFENSFCLSSDVTAAFDPNFADVFDKRNMARINHGIGLCKYTGARGKSGSSDADAETVAFLRRVFDEADVIW